MAELAKEGHVSAEAYDEITEVRTRARQAISSDADKGLIVAGRGTRKSLTFRQLLGACRAVDLP